MSRAREVADQRLTEEVASLASVPHIIPDVLYPSYVASGTSNKLLDGTTSHSGAFGTAQSDGRKYYYTNINGSKPIKDPRIGAHFGSQRYKTKSLQLLEQETATHGVTVYSIDGREWMRLCGDDFVYFNADYGQSFYFNAAGTDTDFIEVTGYFSDLNYLQFAGPARTIRYTLDGGTESGDFGGSTVGTPLSSRYVDAASLVNLGLGATLGIHTVKLRSNSTNIPFYGIELIAQDTSNRNNIQIPSQNVVSYGKKFTVSGTPHYNPFAQNQAGTDVDIGNTTSHGSVATGWAGTGSGYFDDTLDTATSLGLSKWVQNSKYYRPVNGGRVVKWVDSSGNIKTSVNMMPPAGACIGSSTSSVNLPEATSWTTVYYPLFSTNTIDHSQAEVAKTFHWREFGNGGANAGTLGGSYADASMVSAEDDIAYVMDDGLTSLSADSAVITDSNLYVEGNGTGVRYITFIGTGISVNMKHSGSGDAADDHKVYIDGVEIIEWDNTGQSTAYHVEHYAQNLPYGTHILKIARNNAVSSVPVDKEYSFHQPKMPPIPEDAVVIADYMLMADFVNNTGTTNNTLAKGTRKISHSRDIFYDSGTAFAASVLSHGSDSNQYPDNMQGVWCSATSTASLPFFGTEIIANTYNSPQAWTMDMDDSSGVTISKYDNDSHYGDKIKYNDTALVTGIHNVTVNAPAGYLHMGMEVATPIHTSSHYQTFETPYLHELVGGDRNMEQTNLVVTPDGKTWDEITRDVSYLGAEIHRWGWTGTHFESAAVQVSASGTPWICRGLSFGRNYGNKNFAFAYDRHICLKEGVYKIVCMSYHTTNWGQWTVKLNGTEIGVYARNAQPDCEVSGTFVTKLKRGDYIEVEGGHSTVALNYSNYYMERLEG